MFKKFASGGTIALAIAFTIGIASAQTDGPQPSRNDPPPAAPNQSGKDPVPPATDPSLPTRGGKQEPSSKIESTEAGAPILNNGVLTAPAAPQDSQTAPAKFSKRSDEADKLPIAAYTLRHLSMQQRDRLYSALQRPQRRSAVPCTAAGSQRDPTEDSGSVAKSSTGYRFRPAEDAASELVEKQVVAFATRLRSLGR